MDTKPKNLYVESFYVSGARQVLLTLHDQGLLRFVQNKEHKPYDEATCRLLIENREALLHWLGGGGIGYKDHQRDNKGKLTKVTAYIL